MKIFVIGFNKTGTTSIDNIFRRLKINSIHTPKPAVLCMIDKYDAFTDGGHAFFKDYYKRYPDSLFILNTRPLFNWLVSRYKHAKNHGFKNCWCWPVTKQRTQKWILDREKHHKKVLDFFKDKPKQLLVVNIEKKGYENIISKFIGKGNINIKVKKNTINDNNIDGIDKIKENVSKFILDLKYNGNEILLKDKIDVNMYETYL